MKLPSVNTVADTSMATFRRFYLTILFAILGSVYWMILMHLPYARNDAYSHYYRMIMSCYLGMLLSLALAVSGERKELGNAGKILAQFLALAIAAIYYFMLPDHFSESDILRFILFLLVLHLWIAFAPFYAKGQINGFWQYNKALFLRFLAAFLYSGVLYMGLALALLAIENLFKVNIKSVVYGDLWIFIAGIFSTFFFLAGFPDGFDQLESKTDYPKGLKIFTQYILLPIITVYLLILYAYMFKIIFSGQWPYGWVSYLVLALSIAGILSLLLIHPVRNDENNKWILVYNRFFYLAICPLIVLLFLAIERRISDYGITEPRYFVLALTCWLACITVYFLISKKKNIKIIPITLCLLALLSSCGPWGSFSVSRHSQFKSLFGVLEKNKLIYRQRIQSLQGKMTDTDAKKITSIIEYLTETHGYRVLQPYFSQNLDSLMKADKSLDQRSSYGQASRILALMNVETTGRSDSESNKEFSYHSEDDPKVKNIAGYDYFISRFDAGINFRRDSVSRRYVLGTKSLVVQLDTARNKIIIQTVPGIPVELDLFPLFKSLKAKAYSEYSQIDPVEMTLVAENKDLSVKCMINNLAGEYPNDRLKIKELKAEILVKFKE